MQNHRSATLLNTSRSSSDDLPEYVEAAAREIYTALSTFLRSPTIINPVSGEILPWVTEIRIPVSGGDQVRRPGKYTTEYRSRLVRC